VPVFVFDQTESRFIVTAFADNLEHQEIACMACEDSGFSFN